MTIAVAIGLHNFAEGLAIGVSASAGDIGLATVLIVGFALHNATEGFGIVGPLGDVQPSWRWLGHGRPDRRCPDLPRRDARLQRHLRTARAGLLRRCRRRDPLRDRRGLERDAPLRPPRARPLAALRRAFSSACSPTSSSPTAAAESPGPTPGVGRQRFSSGIHLHWESCGHERLGRRGRGEDGGADPARPQRAGSDRRRRRQRRGRGSDGRRLRPTTRSSST